jgi:nitroreductase
MPEDLSRQPLPADTVGLLEGLVSTRAIRRYTDEDIPEADLRAMLFAATRAPSGSNRQPTRYIVLRHGPKAQVARRLLGESARRVWLGKRERDRYDQGSGSRSDSPKTRMADTMTHYVEHYESVPVVILVCHLRYRQPVPSEGGNVYPACQNLLLAARALGYGGVITGFHGFVGTELHELLGIPEQAFIAATITLGRPVGHHGPVRRAPLADVVYEDEWGASTSWAVDPPGSRHTSAGPPGTWDKTSTA